MAHGNHGHNGGHSGGDEKWPNEVHISPVSSYLNVFYALVALTVITVVTAKFVHLKPAILNVILAMVIAAIKASLVVMYFMHQKYETKMNKAIFISGFLFLALLLSFAGLDDLTRWNATKDPVFLEKLEQKRKDITGGGHADAATGSTDAAPAEATKAEAAKDETKH